MQVHEQVLQRGGPAVFCDVIQAEASFYLLLFHLLKQDSKMQITGHIQPAVSYWDSLETKNGFYMLSSFIF